METRTGHVGPVTSWSLRSGWGDDADEAHALSAVTGPRRTGVPCLLRSQPRSRLPGNGPRPRCWPTQLLPPPRTRERQGRAGPSTERGHPCPGAGTPLRSGAVLGQSPSQAREGRPGRPPARVPPVLLLSCQSTEETAETLPSTANQPSIQLIRQSFLNLIFITVSLF